MVNILYSNYNRLLSPEDFKHHLEDLPFPLQVKVKEKRYPISAQNSLIGKILLIKALKKYYKPIPEFSPEDPRTEIFYDKLLSDLSYTRSNRPYLRGYDVDFNIAHSGSLVICAFTDEGKIGIDVKKISPTDYAQFQDQFSQNEISRIDNSKNKDKKFCYYWTIKEAVSKAQGVGLGMPLVHVTISEDETCAQIFSKKWFIHKLDLDVNYCSCFVSDKVVNDGQLMIDCLPKNYWKDPLLNTNLN